MAENSKTENFKQMMGKDKQRNIWITGVVIAFLTIGVGFYMATRNKSKGPDSGAELAALPTVSLVPGTSDNPAYNKLVINQNTDAAKAATESDKSFIPTITNGGLNGGPSPLDLIDKEAEARKKAIAEERKRIADEEEAKKVVPEVPPVYQPIQSQPLQPLYQQVQTQVIIPTRPRPDFTSEDSSIVSALVGMTRIKPSRIENDVDKMPAQFAAGGALNNAASNSVVAGSTAGSAPGSVNPTPKDELVLVKAGTILNAVLETGINSDEPSIVLAKIVTGEFAGSRVMGQMSKMGEKIILQFNSLSAPKYPHSLAISAVAVDPNKERAGLATDVDRHYFARFGLTLGAAFISGYAEAVSRQNTTTSTGLLGTTVAQGALSSIDITHAALGRVGQALAADIAKNTPSGPTITVEAGTAIGVLLMTDLVSK